MIPLLDVVRRIMLRVMHKGQLFSLLKLDRIKDGFATIQIALFCCYMKRGIPRRISESWFGPSDDQQPRDAAEASEDGDV